MIGINREMTASESEALTPAMNDRKRILVLDCQKESRMALCDRLVVLGFEVVPAGDAHFALQHYTSTSDQTPFRGILLELDMPILGGLGTLLEMRKRKPQIPIIVMSSVENIAYLRSALKLGAREYLVKPIDVELLRRKCCGIFLNQNLPPFSKCSEDRFTYE